MAARSLLTGTPEQVAQCTRSYTGQWLAKILDAADCSPRRKWRYELKSSATFLLSWLLLASTFAAYGQQSPLPPGTQEPEESPTASVRAIAEAEAKISAKDLGGARTILQSYLAQTSRQMSARFLIWDTLRI